jgi:hypothetical protein
MSVDEYASLEGRLGNRVVRSGRVWWRRVRPLFYRPLFPFEPLARPVAAAWPARLGGWQRPVAPEEPHNSHLNYTAFEALAAYDVSSLRRAERKTIRRAARWLELRRITDLEEFVREGHPLLQEFFSRTDYHFRRDRLRPAVFRHWAQGLIENPKVLVHGAYSCGRLCQVLTSFRVRDVIFFDVGFAGREGRQLGSIDGLFDHQRRQAAATDAAFICLGPAGAREELDRFKLRRGATVLCLPTRLHLNPVARLALRLCAPLTYKRVVGMDESASIDYASLLPGA